MDALRKEMELKGLPWIETCVISGSKDLDIKDINDDLTRELGL